MRALNFKLFGSLVLLYLIPNLYLILRVNFLGNIPENLGIDTVSQISWVSLMYEVIHEAMLLPLYFLIGKSINNVDEFRNTVCSGYVVIFFTNIILSIFISIFARPLCHLMAQNPSIIDESVSYIRLETFSSIFSTLLKYSLLILVLLNKPKFIYLTITLQGLFTMIFDIIFISQFNFSLNLGAKGVAFSSICTNILALLVTVFYLRTQFPLSFKNLSYRWLKDWINLGKYSCLESLIRNMSFSIMIIRMVNLVQEQGNYWIANNFIWGILLVPVLALSDLIKREASENFSSLKKLIPAYVKLTIIIIGIWILSMSLWNFILKDIMNVNNYKLVLWLIRFLLAFYMIFAFNSIMTAVLYGRGKMKYLFYRSICIDVIYYGVFFILYLNGQFTPSLKSICIMFGFGMILNNIPTIYFYRKTMKEESGYN